MSYHSTYIPCMELPFDQNLDLSWDEKFLRSRENLGAGSDMAPTVPNLGSYSAEPRPPRPGLSAAELQDVIFFSSHLTDCMAGLSDEAPWTRK